MMDEATIIRAHLAALVSMGDSTAPLTRMQAVRVAFAAIHTAALAIDAADDFPHASVENRLTLAGIRAVHEAQAGSIERSLLISRINALDPDERTAYSLRYEHDLSDSSIASAIGIPEDAVVALMLRALLKLTGVQE